MAEKEHKTIILDQVLSNLSKLISIVMVVIHIVSFPIACWHIGRECHTPVLRY